MLHSPRKRKREAATAVEAAVVLPIAIFLVLATMVGGMGVSEYQQMAHIARETARFASVHGGQYAKQNAAAIAAGTLPKVDKQYLIDYARSKASGLNKGKLEVKVTMTVLTPGATSASSTETVDWDTTTTNQNRSPYSAWINNSTTPASNVEVCNVVTVQVSYLWTPGLFGVGPKKLTSTVVTGMSF
jgi:Flp pilus assembly protein TadG